MNQQQQQTQAGALPATRDDLRDSESRANARFAEQREHMNRMREDLRADIRTYFGVAVTLVGLGMIFGVCMTAIAVAASS